MRFVEIGYSPLAWEWAESCFAWNVDRLLSRCIDLPLARRDLAKAFAERAREIADQEGLNGRSIEAYVRLCRKHRNNLRAVLQAVEAGDMAE